MHLARVRPRIRRYHRRRRDRVAAKGGGGGQAVARRGFPNQTHAGSDHFGKFQLGTGHNSYLYLDTRGMENSVLHALL